MRVLACAVAFSLLFLASAVPVDAKPFPETRKVLPDERHDTLRDADHSSAALLRSLRRALPAPTLPSAPLPANGALEVRAMMTMPGLQGRDEVVAVTWIAASSGTWTGVYALESDDGRVLPQPIEVDAVGILLFMHGGAASSDASIDGARYHFLGIDGAYATRSIPPIPLLPDAPVLGRAALAGAHASARGADPEVLLVAPWNLLGHDATLGMTLLDAQGHVLDEIVLSACADVTATSTEAGCRLLYALALSSDLSRFELWHLDEHGARVVDEAHDRASLTAGVRFAA